MSGCQFHKYSCTGNDFLLLDNRDGEKKFSTEQVMEICSRRTGVGADGIIMLEQSETASFRMKIINSDGSEAEMCGNGLRGISHFAHDVLKVPMSDGKYTVQTFNSLYEAKVNGEVVEIKMTEAYDENIHDLSFIDIEKKYFINTGVPHVVLFVFDIDRVQIQSLGSQIRYNKIFENGTNVNFVEITDRENQRIRVRTYERGVEAETLACGTGNLACALACKNFFDWSGEISVTNSGGSVSVNLKDDDFWYKGPVKCVYEATFR